MQAALVLLTAFSVSVGWAFYVMLLNKDVRSAARDARAELNSALERAWAAEAVANELNARVLRAEAALNSDTDLQSAAQAARIILFAATEPAPRPES